MPPKSTLSNVIRALKALHSSVLRIWSDPPSYLLLRLAAQSGVHTILRVLGWQYHFRLHQLFRIMSLNLQVQYHCEHRIRTRHLDSTPRVKFSTRRHDQRTGGNRNDILGLANPLSEADAAVLVPAVSDSRWMVWLYHSAVSDAGEQWRQGSMMYIHAIGAYLSAASIRLFTFAAGPKCFLRSSAVR